MTHREVLRCLLITGKNGYHLTDMELISSLAIGTFEFVVKGQKIIFCVLFQTATYSEQECRRGKWIIFPEL